MDTELATRTDLSSDTSAALLLCSGLGSPDGPKPLSPSEYNHLAKWLKNNNRRPGDLLSAGLDSLPEGPDLPARDRQHVLLERGRLLGLALTKWADFGIWVHSRSDATYPERLRRLLGAAPPSCSALVVCPRLTAAGSPSSARATLTQKE